jgi:hypothetical protein
MINNSNTKLKNRGELKLYYDNYYGAVLRKS